MIHIETLLNHPDVWEYKLIPTQDIPFSQAVADACSSNACGKYGTCWTCPPGVGHYAQWQQKILHYRTAAVFTCKHALEDCFDFEGMMLAQEKTMDLLHGFTTQLRQANMPFLALGCAGCRLCSQCTYPEKPCRFPDKALVSVEACGVDVVTLSRNIGIHYNNGTNTVTYFCIILF